MSPEVSNRPGKQSPLKGIQQAIVERTKVPSVDELLSDTAKFFSKLSEQGAYSSEVPDMEPPSLGNEAYDLYAMELPDLLKLYTAFGAWLSFAHDKLGEVKARHALAAPRQETVEKLVYTRESIIQRQAVSNEVTKKGRSVAVTDVRSKAQSNDTVVKHVELVSEIAAEVELWKSHVDKYKTGWLTCSRAISVRLGGSSSGSSSYPD